MVYFKGDGFRASVLFPYINGAVNYCLYFSLVMLLNEGELFKYYLINILLDLERVKKYLNLWEWKKLLTFVSMEK